MRWWAECQPFQSLKSLFHLLIEFNIMRQSSSPGISNFHNNASRTTLFLMKIFKNLIARIWIKGCHDICLSKDKNWKEGINLVYYILAVKQSITSFYFLVLRLFLLLGYIEKRWPIFFNNANFHWTYFINVKMLALGGPGQNFL